jgi:sRNA-binding protein
MADMDDNLLSSKEVLAYLKIHRQTLWRLEKSGAVQPVKIGTVQKIQGIRDTGQAQDQITTKGQDPKCILTALLYC